MRLSYTQPSTRLLYKTNTHAKHKQSMKIMATMTFLLLLYVPSFDHNISIETVVFTSATLIIYYTFS